MRRNHVFVLFPFLRSIEYTIIFQINIKTMYIYSCFKLQNKYQAVLKHKSKCGVVLVLQLLLMIMGLQWTQRWSVLQSFKVYWWSAQAVYLTMNKMCKLNNMMNNGNINAMNMKKAYCVLEHDPCKLLYK